jgi:hypothetical protein
MPVNVPLCIVAVVAILAAMALDYRRERRRERLRQWRDLYFCGLHDDDA